jgi:hypothetical protein
LSFDRPTCRQFTAPHVPRKAKKPFEPWIESFIEFFAENAIGEGDDADCGLTDSVLSVRNRHRHREITVIFSMIE